MNTWDSDMQLGADPGNAECWAWKAYCHKRQQQLSEAVAAIDEALRLERRDICNWLFNAACYRALNGVPFTEIKPLLLRAWPACRSAQRPWLLAMMQREPDLHSVRACPEFERLVSTLQRSL